MRTRRARANASSLDVPAARCRACSLTRAGICEMITDPASSAGLRAGELSSDDSDRVSLADSAGAPPLEPRAAQPNASAPSSASEKALRLRLTGRVHQIHLHLLRTDADFSLGQHAARSEERRVGIR